jgi:hypothetical protein
MRDISITGTSSPVKSRVTIFVNTSYIGTGRKKHSSDFRRNPRTYACVVKAGRKVQWSEALRVGDGMGNEFFKRFARQ